MNLTFLGLIGGRLSGVPEGFRMPFIELANAIGDTGREDTAEVADVEPPHEETDDVEDLESREKIEDPEEVDDDGDGDGAIDVGLPCAEGNGLYGSLRSNGEVAGREVSVSGDRRRAAEDTCSDLMGRGEMISVPRSAS